MRQNNFVSYSSTWATAEKTRPRSMTSLLGTGRLRQALLQEHGPGHGEWRPGTRDRARIHTSEEGEAGCGGETR